MAENVGREVKRKKQIPVDLFTKCPDCGGTVFKKAVENKLKVCPDCGFHFTLQPRERIDVMLDPGSFTEMWSDLAPANPLDFEGDISYRKKLQKAQKDTGEKDACMAGTGRIDGREIGFGLTNSKFMMGSMGSVVGEKIARLFEYGIEKGLPVVFVSGSGGGARMYEGCLSLMQLAKTSAAIARHGEKGLAFISVLTNPTMAGVMASFAALGDIMIAEPKALIGFTGPRVIEQTIKQELPEGFQTSEFLMEHGFVDRVTSREKLREEISRFLGYLTP